MNKHTSIAAFTIIVTAAGIGLSSCGQSGGGDTTAGMQVKQADSGLTVKKAGQAPANTNMAITLPVLDALFYEEGFETELKTKLSLSAAQITKLKTVSRESVSDLAEDGVGDYTGSARAEAQRSEEQIRSILGDEKANQLFQMVNDRYAGGDIAGMMPTKPNAVPTDTRIVVNAPAYRLDVFQDGNLQKTYKVGIGYPEFPLPTGMRRAENIIFNPTWTPPDEPWVKGKFKPGQKVEAGSKDNPLGPLKIPIGAPSLIHGGKAVAKLGNFASHGCVGMTNDMVQDFAATVAQLSGSGMTQDSIIAMGKKKGQTKYYKLPKPLAVELRYETIVAESGGLHIYRDVYERGTNTIENAKQVLNVYGVSYDKLSEPEKSALQQALMQMNRDPQGKPIVDDIAATQDATPGTGADSGRKDGVAASKVDRAKKGKVTYTIVGKKDIIVPIAVLQGKGYPAPVNYNTGLKAASTASATAGRH